MKYIIDLPEQITISDGVISMTGNVGWSVIEKAVHKAVPTRHEAEQGEGYVEEMAKTLEYLDACGGLGMDKHEMIGKALYRFHHHRKILLDNGGSVDTTPTKPTEPSKPEAKFSVDYWMVIQELVKLRSFDYKSKGYNADECQTIFNGNINRIISMWDGKESICDKCEVLAKLGESKPTEPLAVLADRKGLFIDHSGAKVSDLDKVNHEWFIVIGNGLNTKTINENTYALAEAKARAYLSALPDAKGGNV